MDTGTIILIIFAILLLLVWLPMLIVSFRRTFRRNKQETK